MADRRTAHPAGAARWPAPQRGPRGYDAGKCIKGRKRPVLTDTNGLLVAAIVHAADIQDRDGAPALLASVRTCPRRTSIRSFLANANAEKENLKT